MKFSPIFANLSKQIGNFGLVWKKVYDVSLKCLLQPRKMTFNPSSTP